MGKEYFVAEPIAIVEHCRLRGRLDLMRYWGGGEREDGNGNYYGLVAQCWNNICVYSSE
jgi:hypothetical protein